MTERLQGVGVSPGIAVGRVHLLHLDSLPVVPAPIPPERIDDEIELFGRALEAAQGELAELRDRVHAELGAHYAGIFDAQLLILDDPSLASETASRIRVGRVSSRWALKEVVGEYARRFAELESDYLRERGGDLADVHHRVQRLLAGRSLAPADGLPEGPIVIVAPHVVPSDAVLLAGKGVVGLATDVGGRTSHTAILAQALSVPAVAGLHDVTQRVCEGDTILLDGSSGTVALHADAQEVDRARERRRTFLDEERRAMSPESHLPAVTRDGVEITLRANIEFTFEVESAMRFGAHGIGLYRSEFLFLSRSPELPTEEEHFRAYAEIAERAAPHPVVIRTLDLGGEKYFHDVLDRREPNPVLGLRGVRLCLKRPDIFLPQLRGLLRASVHPNLCVLLPLVTTADEVREVRALLSQERAGLRRRGVAVPERLALGVMIEIPAAAAAADRLAAEADFFSIGTNDLIQYALAVDRDNESVSYLYQPGHPAVLRLLRMAVEAAEREGIAVAVCGEMASDPETLGLLVGLGIREVSVQPRAIASLRRHVREMQAGEMARRVQSVLEPVGGASERPDRGGAVGM